MIDSREFVELQLYYKMQPFGPVRGDINAAFICQAVSEPHRDRKKQRKPFSWTLWMPDFLGGGKKKAQSPKQVWNTLKAFFNQYTANREGMGK